MIHRTARERLILQARDMPEGVDAIEDVYKKLPGIDVKARTLVDRKSVV